MPDSDLSLASSLSLSTSLSLCLISLRTPQQIIESPLNLHACQLSLLPAILGIPLCVRFTALGIFDVSVNIGPKFGPCLLQLFDRPPPEGPLVPFPHPPPYPISSPIAKITINPPFLSLFIIIILPLLYTHLLVNHQPFLPWKFIYLLKPHFLLLIFHKMTYH